MVRVVFEFIEIYIRVFVILIVLLLFLLYYFNPKKIFLYDIVFIIAGYLFSLIFPRDYAFISKIILFAIYITLFYQLHFIDFYNVNFRLILTLFLEFFMYIFVILPILIIFLRRIDISILLLFILMLYESHLHSSNFKYNTSRSKHKLRINNAVDEYEIKSFLIGFTFLLIFEFSKFILENNSNVEFSKSIILSLNQGLVALFFGIILALLVEKLYSKTRNIRKLVIGIMFSFILLILFSKLLHLIPSLALIGFGIPLVQISKLKNLSYAITVNLKDAFRPIIFFFLGFIFEFNSLKFILLSFILYFLVGVFSIFSDFVFGMNNFKFNHFFVDYDFYYVLFSVYLITVHHNLAMLLLFIFLLSKLFNEKLF